MPKPKIDATISLRSGDRFLVGRDRIKLLEAVAKHGSISKAAPALIANVGASKGVQMSGGMQTQLP